MERELCRPTEQSPMEHTEDTTNSPEVETLLTNSEQPIHPTSEHIYTSPSSKLANSPHQSSLQTVRKYNSLQKLFLYQYSTFME